MILSYAYDIEALPNFFSITIISINDYLKQFKDACKINKKGKKEPVPLTQIYTVKEIIDKLDKVKKKKFYITDTDDSQLNNEDSYDDESLDDLDNDDDLDDLVIIDDSEENDGDML